MNGSLVIIIQVTSAEQYEKLMSLAGSTVGDYDPIKRRGEVVFTTRKAALEAQTFLHYLHT